MSYYPTHYRDYAWIREKKYTIRDLLSICDFFNFSIKQKKKKDIVEGCYTFLKNGYYASRIQREWKRRRILEFNRTQGPAMFKRSLCNNVEDFLTTEKMSEIDYVFFISFKDHDFVYGFNVISVYNLLTKKTPYNPYTRTPFTHEFICMVQRRMKLNYLFHHTDHPIYHEIQLPSYDNQLTTLFQKMDSLGNYTQIEWFLSLNLTQLKRFLFELHDIWDYRAQLTPVLKMKICPPLGRPFRHVPLQHDEHTDIRMLRQYSCSVMDELLNKSEENEYQTLGCYYILSAITLVNPAAAESMPWLYQSVL
jgi:hypothetical protein